MLASAVSPGASESDAHSAWCEAPLQVDRQEPAPLGEPLPARRDRVEEQRTLRSALAES